MKTKLNPLLLGMLTKASISVTVTYQLAMTTNGLTSFIDFDNEAEAVKAMKERPCSDTEHTHLQVWAVDQFGTKVALVDDWDHFGTANDEFIEEELAPLDPHPGHEHDPQDEILKTLESIKPMTWEEYQALHVDWMVSESELSRAYSEYLSEQVKA